ncbi:unnamed protein product, partial [Rotaria sordida]
MITAPFFQTTAFGLSTTTTSRPSITMQATLIPKATSYTTEIPASIIQSQMSITTSELTDDMLNV